MKLCDNCKQIGEKTGSWDKPIQAFPVGFEKGTQREPYNETVDLCAPCRHALSHANFNVLHARYKDSP